ncbi:conserved hypothetical protein (plasmid) [Rhodococcus jostii RHA1]|uniref:Uncharacterized protein n=1 Tax=Rhodococcus jostii (strain RHA1) TaxID=101510 RepID=Q0RVQ7_RHOJR|nr:conserved hypothetical protein [Rhodococcus jostii RHA1]
MANSRSRSAAVRSLTVLILPWVGGDPNCADRRRRDERLAVWHTCQYFLQGTCRFHCSADHSTGSIVGDANPRHPPSRGAEAPYPLSHVREHRKPQRRPGAAVSGHRRHLSGSTPHHGGDAHRNGHRAADPHLHRGVRRRSRAMVSGRGRVRGHGPRAHRRRRDGSATVSTARRARRVGAGDLLDRRRLARILPRRRRPGHRRPPRRQLAYRLYLDTDRQAIPVPRQVLTCPHYLLSAIDGREQITIPTTA